MQKLSLTKNYTAYSDYKSVVLEEGEKIPLHWNVDKISNIGFIPKERSPYGELLSVYLDRGVIRASDGSLGTHAVSEDLSKYQVVKKGDLILNNQQAWRGSVGVSELEGIISPAYILFRFQKNIFPRYYNYLCRSPLVVDQFRLHSKGVGNIQRQIQGNTLKNVKVIIPPKEEQEKIAWFLDEQTARIDETIAKKERLIELLKEKRTATINHAVTKGLDINKKQRQTVFGMVPEDWSVLKIKSVSKLVSTGGTPDNKPDYFGDDHSWFTPGDFQVPELVDSSRKLSQLALEDGQCKIYPPESVLLVSIGATLGKVGYSENYFSCNQQINVIVPDKKKMLHKYLYYFLSVNINFLYSNSLITTMAILNQSKLKNIEVLVPPLSEQQKIVDSLEEKIPAYAKALTSIENSIEKLQEFKSSLISHAVTGKIKI